MKSAPPILLFIGLAVSLVFLKFTWDDKTTLQEACHAIAQRYNVSQEELGTTKQKLDTAVAALEPTKRALESANIQLAQERETDKRALDAANSQIDSEKSAKADLRFQLTQSMDREAQYKLEIFSAKQELQTSTSEINQERELGKRLQAKLAKLDSFGHADPRKVSAAFIKAVADREINLAVELHCDATWDCANKLDKFPQGRFASETYEEELFLPLRTGMLLGVRNHLFYAIVALPSELELSLRKIPETITNSSFFSKTENRYLLRKADLTFKFQAQHDELDLSSNTWIVVHAWNQASMTILVIASENQSAPSMDLFPYIVKDETDWLKSVERTNVLYPVSQLNGCVSLIPPKFDRDYDHRGTLQQWTGFPGSIHAVFAPIEEASMPIFHSLIIQQTASQAQWIPMWAEKKQLDAPAEQFDLGTYVKVNLLKNGSPVTVPVRFAPQSERLKFMESYGTLMGRTKSL